MLTKFLTVRQQRIAVAGLFLILVALLLKLLVLSKQPLEPIPVPPVHHTAATTHAKSTKPPIDKSLPRALRRQLAHHKIVVAVVYSPGQDADAVAAAKQGAAGAHAGFAALDVGKESIAMKLAMKTTPSNPSVLVITRPGTIALYLPGFIDAEAVVAAVRSAR